MLTKLGNALCIKHLLKELLPRCEGVSVTVVRKLLEAWDTPFIVPWKL